MGEKIGKLDSDSHPNENRYLIKLMKILAAAENETVEDFTVPHIKQTLIDVYPFFIALYAFLVLIALATNLRMVYLIIRKKLYTDPTCAFLVNIAVCHIIECTVVLPITLAVLLIENWIFGKVVCYFLPILQDTPIHVSMMTFVLIAIDRYRLICDPDRPRIPAFVCAIGAWFSAVCIVLPHPIYTSFYDLEDFRKEHFQGVGLCITNLNDNIEPYIRGLFLLTYVAPLTIMAYIYVKSGQELKRREGPYAIAMYKIKMKTQCSKHGNNDANEFSPSGNGKMEDEDSRVNFDMNGLPDHLRKRESQQPELNFRREKRTQKYLIMMVSTFAVLFSPLMILKLAKLSIVETYQNMKPLDIIFLFFIWLGFLSTVTTPVLFMKWQMSRTSFFKFIHHLPNKARTEMSSGRLSQNSKEGIHFEYRKQIRNNDMERPSRGVSQFPETFAQV